VKSFEKKSLVEVTNNEDDLLSISEDAFAQADELAEQEEQGRLYLSVFEKLSERCKEIIRLALSDEHQEKIAAQLGVSYGYLRKKKSECTAALIQMIKSEINKR
ncbi:sigma-70 family RNA polymerase sigma factor, partial [Pseudoxanthomonas sp. SGD-10]